MLEGKDFVILSNDELLLLYNFLSIKADGISYRELSDAGILELVQKTKRHLFKGEDWDK